jgi:hypothetical protein
MMTKNAKRLQHLDANSMKTHQDPAYRIAIAILIVWIFEFCENSKSHLNDFSIRCRAKFAFWACSWVSDLVIKGWLPGKIGRHLVIDTLIAWSDSR